MSFSYEKASEIALKLNCDPATVLAVAEVESGGGHDLPDGRPKILFEAHWFSKLTGGKYDDSHPGISSPVWDRSLYKGGTAEWGRLDAACALDRNAALQSASWGLFQIMGFNYKACGFDTVSAFVEFIKGPDDADMEAFINFVRSNPKILKAMQEKDWRTFALHYNGPGAVPSYSAKMSDAYAKYAGQPSRVTVGPPLPVADPTMPVKNPITSKTLITTAAAGIGSASIVVENIKPALDAIQSTTATVQQAGTTLSGVKDAFSVFDNGHVMTVAVLAVVLGLLIYLGWRHFSKLRSGLTIQT